jgi:preprotein translocase subunit SecG
MNWYQIVMDIILVLTSLFLIVVVLLQPGKSAGLSGAISGGAETFFGKHKARSWEGKLVTLTKVAIAVLIALSITMVIVDRFVG